VYPVFSEFIVLAADIASYAFSGQLRKLFRRSCPY
jgi:hypothetical protein